MITTTLKKTGLGALLGASLATILGFSFAAQAALPTNNELKIGISQEFENLNPLIIRIKSKSKFEFIMKI